MKMKPITNSAYKLLHKGSIALSQVEANGMKIDVEYLRRAIVKTGGQIQKLTLKMKEDKVFRIWRREFGQRTNMGSREQLGRILFSVMDYPCPDDSYTKTGRPKADAEALELVDLGFVKDFVRLEKLKKTKSTYLEGILRETVDGFLHPVFNLHFARTFRSSSDHPNFQNMPKKDPEMAKLVRRAFIARPNYRIVEIDYSGVEICCAACYHKDPKMISYIEDETKDLHRDMAARCYMLARKQVTSDVRYCSKNMFVFPQFYGDYYIHCAENLWGAIGSMHLKTKDGLSLRKHLRGKGIERLGECNPDEKSLDGTFEKHIQKVERDFWNKFKVYAQWKKDWWNAYLNKGYFDTLTGFRIEGHYKRNDVMNYPVQGSAFHWLLWSLIRVQIKIQKLLKKYGMKTFIVGQIHDSIVADVHKKEVRNYLEIAQQVMTEDVRKHWKWIIVPLRVEAEASPVDGSWYEKEEIKIR